MSATVTHRHINQKLETLDEHLADDGASPLPKLPTGETTSREETVPPSTLHEILDHLDYPTYVEAAVAPLLSSVLDDLEHLSKR